jgi:hypothetical protein
MGGAMVAAWLWRVSGGGYADGGRLDGCAVALNSMKQPVLPYSSQPSAGWEPTLQRAALVASTCALAVGAISIGVGEPYNLDDAKGIVLEWAAMCDLFGATLSAICLLQYSRKRMRNVLCLGMCLVPLGWFCFVAFRIWIWTAQGAK